MDLLEKNSKIAITTAATIFALDFVLPEEYSCIETASYRNFFLLTTVITVGGVLYDKGVEMWKATSS